MKRLSLLILFIIPLVLFSQSDTSYKGIQWTTGLSWQQVLDKAKQENKYIFIDAYATWCGPCKAMDKKVYINDTIGDFFNDKFISVKVQMDKTQKDNPQVVSWYTDADSLHKWYKVESYPTFVFLNPRGQIIHKEQGYKGVKEFLAVGETSVRPGTVYNNPYAVYDVLIEDYMQGKIIDYERLPYLIRTAQKLGDKELSKQLLKELSNYALSLKPERRYNKERIEVWSLFTFSSSTKVFQFFYKDHSIIDKVMNQKGYAASIVDKTIYKEIVMPFFQSQVTGSIMGKNLPVRMDGKIQPDYTEADWRQLYDSIRKKFDAGTGCRNLLMARIEWYKQHRNYPKYAIYYTEKLETYGEGLPSAVNNYAFDVFKYVIDKRLINNIIPWVEKFMIQPSLNYITTLDSNSKSDVFDRYGNMFDTYANLLYKAGRIAESIQWEEKAISLTRNEVQKKKFIKIIDKMKRQEPTYLEEGAIWSSN